MSIAASILSSLAAGGVLAVVWVFKFQPCHFEDGSYTYLSWDLGDHNTLNGCVFNWHPVLVRSPQLPLRWLRWQAGRGSGLPVG